MLPVSDKLMDELRKELPKLTNAVLDEPELAREFEILARIIRKAIRQVLNETDRLLAETNSAIARLRIAYSSLEHYEATKAVTGVDADAPRERLPPGGSILAIGLSVSAVTPVFAWGAWQYLTGIPRRLPGTSNLCCHAAPRRWTVCHLVLDGEESL